MTALDRIRGALIVSSQVMDDRSPLKDPEILAKMAAAAELGGAGGFRVDGAPVVRALRARTQAPILAIAKAPERTHDNYITVRIQDIGELVAAGADLIAAQATTGSRPGPSFAEIVTEAHRLGVPVMADISTLAEAEAAVADGVDAVGTTMVGFTPETTDAARPPIELVQVLVSRLDIPVVVEGGVWTPEQVTASFEAGAWAVVAGSSVTAPDLIAARLSAGAVPPRSAPEGARTSHG